MIVNSPATIKSSKHYFLESSTDTLRNSFNAFSMAKEVFLALVPAALFPLSTCEAASFAKSANNWFRFSASCFILFLIFKLKNKDRVDF